MVKIKNKLLTKLSFSSGVESVVLFWFAISLVAAGAFFILGGCSLSRELGSMKVYFCGGYENITSWVILFSGAYFIYLWWGMEKP